jgi:hypothetical protein
LILLESYFIIVSSGFNNVYPVTKWEQVSIRKGTVSRQGSLNLQARRSLGKPCICKSRSSSEPE